MKKAKKQLTHEEFSRMGGMARKKQMRPEDWVELGEKAAEARWGKKKKGVDNSLAP